MIESPRISVEDIKGRIKGTIGEEIFFYESIGSTNTIAAGLAEEGKAEGVVVIADSQYKGRGKFGRLWISPTGVGIYMSIILRPKLEPKNAKLITMMAAVGCTYALRRMTGLNVTIKWPNDLIVSDRKIGGILIEIKTNPQNIVYAITGIGINVNTDSNSFPEEIRGIATSVKEEKGAFCSRNEIIVEILNEIDYWYRMLKGGGGKVLTYEWQKLISTVGKKVTVTVGNETLAGVAESIDDEGMLVLRLPSGIERRLSAGDLTLS